MKKEEKKKGFEKVKPKDSIGTKGKIGKDEVADAVSILKKYK